MKISFENEGKIKTFSDKGKLREFHQQNFPKIWPKEVGSSRTERKEFFKKESWKIRKEERTL